MPLKAAIRALEDVADEIGRIESAEEPNGAVDAAPPPQSGEKSVSSSRQPRKDGSQKSTGGIVTFDDHAAYTNAPLRPILYELRSRVLGLDGLLRQGEQCTAGRRIAYKIPGSKIFLEVKVQRAAIVLHLADGRCPDPAGVTEDIPEAHGWGQLKKRITIVRMSDLEAAMPFIEAAYHAHP